MAYSIPASNIVEFLPQVISSLGTNLEMNGLILTENDTIPTSSIALEFNSVNSVASYFGIDSDEYIAARIYFLGYTNKQATPRALFFGRQITENVPGWLRSGPLTVNLANIQSVTDGSLNLTIDGEAVELTGISFADVASLDLVASELQTLIDAESTGTTVTYSSLFNAFIITSGTNGPDSSVVVNEAASGTDLAELLGFNDAAGQVVSPGSYALTIDENMQAIIDVTANWFSFTTINELSPADAMPLAAWASGHYGWLYIPYTTQEAAYTQTSSADLASQLTINEYTYTAAVYGTMEYAVFAMSCIASIAWQNVNGVITLAFKSSSLLAAYTIDESQYEVLRSKRYNLYGKFALRNYSFSFQYPGVLTYSTDFNFIDPYVNNVWLANRLQLIVMNGLQSQRRLPYNATGYNVIYNWLVQGAEESLNNGIIDTGVSLDAVQIAALMQDIRQSDQDIVTQKLYNDGYYIEIIDPGATVRANRETPEVHFYYTYAGSIHEVKGTVTAIL